MKNIPFIKILLSFFNGYIFSLGFLWLFIESYSELTNSNLNIKFQAFLLVALAMGILWIIFDGFLVSGFFKTNIEIRSNSFDTIITVKFGNLLKQDGWKAISVNDHFDSIVDEKHVSSNSLHGIVLKQFWGGNIDNWDKQVAMGLSNKKYMNSPRKTGKTKKYTLGTTTAAELGKNKFLFVALAKTDLETLQAKTCPSELIDAVKGLLKEARKTCSGSKLTLPLFGSGLSRTGIKNNILVDMLLVAIFEETKKEKITDQIQIILPWNKFSEINLNTLKTDWS